MKRKEIFKGIISTMQSEIPYPVEKRDMALPVDHGLMVTVTGVRRCGKSSMMKIVANSLYDSGVSRERILWINFDDERIADMHADELDEAIQAYREMYPTIPISETYIFFDEIQNIQGWELFVMRLYKSYSKNIYISGSNSRMLSSQIATALRGWPMEFEAFPLSFGEYIRFKGIETNRHSEQGRALLQSASQSYLHESAYPEVVLMSERSLQLRKVQGYFNTMLFRDLVEHYRLSSPEVVRYFLRRIMANLTKPTSVNAIYNDLKSQGRRVDKNRLYEIAEMACEIFLFFKVGRWSRSIISEAMRLPKYYVIDNGLRQSLVMPQSDDDGKLLENAVFLVLRRHLGPMQKISYFMETHECDFVVQTEEHIEELIQVCWTLADDDILTRELRGLREASETTGCRRCTIVTFGEKDTINHDNLIVEVIPYWEWAIGREINMFS